MVAVTLQHSSQVNSKGEDLDGFAILAFANSTVFKEALSVYETCSFYEDHNRGKKVLKTSLLFGVNDKCCSPQSAKADSLLTLEGHFLPGLSRCLFYIYCFCLFLEEIASQMTRYHQVRVDLFSNRLLLLGELTSTQILGIDFARARRIKEVLCASKLKLRNSLRL